MNNASFESTLEINQVERDYFLQLQYYYYIHFIHIISHHHLYERTFVWSFLLNVLISCADVPLEQPGGGGDDQRPEFEWRQARQDQPPLQPDRCYQDHTDGSLPKQPQGRLVTSLSLRDIIIFINWSTGFPQRGISQHYEHYAGRLKYFP